MHQGMTRIFCLSAPTWRVYNPGCSSIYRYPWVHSCWQTSLLYMQILQKYQ